MIVHYKHIGYNINIMRQSACLVFNPITVNNFASLFNCMPVGRASDSMIAQTYRYFPKFLDGQAWANSADPDQTAPRGAV